MNTNDAFTIHQFIHNSQFNHISAWFWLLIMPFPWFILAAWTGLQAARRYNGRHAQPPPKTVTFQAHCQSCHAYHQFTIPAAVFLDFKAFCKCSKPWTTLQFSVINPHAPDPRAEFACPAFTRPRC